MIFSTIETNQNKFVIYYKLACTKFQLRRINQLKQFKVNVNIYVNVKIR